MRRFLSLWYAVAALAVPLLAGCIVVPSPHYGPGRIEHSYLQQIKPGVTSREDVLLELGPPSRRLSADRFFVFDYEEVVAWAGTFGAATDVTSHHLLAIEFAPDGRVVRFEDLAGILRDVEKKFATWLEQADAAPAQVD